MEIETHMCGRSDESTTHHIVYFGVFITGESKSKEFRNVNDFFGLASMLDNGYTLWVRAQSDCGCKSIKEFVWSCSDATVFCALFLVFSCQHQKGKEIRGCWWPPYSGKWLILRAILLAYDTTRTKSIKPNFKNWIWNASAGNWLGNVDDCSYC